MEQDNLCSQFTSSILQGHRFLNDAHRVTMGGDYAGKFKGLDVHGSTYEAKLRRLLGGMSIFTLLMTIPQVLTIWVSHQAAGSLYLPGALICFPPFSVSWTL